MLKLLLITLRELKAGLQKFSKKIPGKRKSKVKVIASFAPKFLYLVTWIHDLWSITIAVDLPCLVYVDRDKSMDRFTTIYMPCRLESVLANLFS